MVQTVQRSTEPEITLDELLRSVAYWLEHSNSDVTWPFVKRGLGNLIEDLKLTLESRSDRSAIEEDIAKIEEFIERQEDASSRV
jgi:hypothetical protein